MTKRALVSASLVSDGSVMTFVLLIRAQYMSLCEAEHNRNNQRNGNLASAIVKE
jgi:hypothetical protein